jgi:hypothetical protein
MPQFRGSKGFYEYEVSDILAYNLKDWIDYSLLEMGAYTPVTFTSDASGYTVLERTYDDRYGADRCFEGLGPSWVWENDVQVIASGLIQPFRVSGVYVNNTFHPTSGIGLNQHIIDYENGRVVFTSGVTSNAIVKCEYVFRDVGTYFTDSRQWKTVLEDYVDRFEQLDELAPSGMAQVLKENRVWLPSVFIETRDIANEGLQLGGGDIKKCSVFYHILSDLPFSAKRIADFLNNQELHRLNLYDINKIPRRYNMNGSLASGITYKMASEREGAFFWTYADIENSEGGGNGIIGDIYIGDCRQTVNVYRYLITY